MIIYTIQPYSLGQAILCSLQKVFLAVICFIWLAKYLLLINPNMINMQKVNDVALFYWRQPTKTPQTSMDEQN